MFGHTTVMVAKGGSVFLGVLIRLKWGGGRGGRERERERIPDTYTTAFIRLFEYFWLSGPCAYSAVPLSWRVNESESPGVQCSAVQVQVMA